MSNGAMKFWAAIAWAMALVTTVSAVFLCIHYGTVEVPGRYGMESATNWPLVVGVIVSAIYSLLFAVAMTAMKITVINSRTALGLIIGMTKGAGRAEDKPLQ